jgi:hypothetical protein
VSYVEEEEAIVDDGDVLCYGRQRHFICRDHTHDPYLIVAANGASCFATYRNLLVASSSPLP